MEEKTVRVLHVLGRLNMGGAESRIMDLYRNIDRSKVQFDFLVHTKAEGGDDSSEALLQRRAPEDYDSEVRSLGGRIYCLPRFTGTNLLEYKKACRAFFAAHHDFAAVEGHMTSMAGVYLPIAKKAGALVTIAHARSAGVDPGIRGLATKLFRRNLAARCDVCFSCSGAASLAVFGKEAVDAGRVIQVPNAIELSDFAFDPAARKRIRAEFGIPEHAILLGHVGRFDAMKNQAYIAKLCARVRREHPERPLYALFAGQGPLLDQVRAAFAAAGMEKTAFFPGRCDRGRTRDFYQAFDLFVFPSLYEGLPGTMLEAQAAGLCCLMSDQITDEVRLTPGVQRLSLEDEASWADAIGNLVIPDDAGRSARSRENRLALAGAGYDAAGAAKTLQDFYLACERSDIDVRNLRLSFKAADGAGGAGEAQ